MAWKLQLTLLVALRYLTEGVLAVPSPRELGSDVHYLMYNDLYGNSSEPAFQTSLLVVSTPQTYDSAHSTCVKLGEQLYLPNNRTRYILSYAAYETSGLSQFDQYWVTGFRVACPTIKPNGTNGIEPCERKLPVLCTNSAPFSYPNAKDTSERWRTSVEVGGFGVTGYRDKTSFRFLGIKYAPQPERWTYPTLADSNEDMEALDFGPQCIQGSGTGSEDCLSLNIWTPYLPSPAIPPKNATAPPWFPLSLPPMKKLKPVYFFIHGGGFVAGTGSDSVFDGGSIVSRGDVVYVTMNYRVGPLGYLALDDGKTNGNYGLADQITALKWVRNYIANFGGDPDKITIAGQSAGAASVRALLASKEAKGLYKGAMMMSNLGGIGYGERFSKYYSIAEQYTAAAAPWLSRVGCSNTTDPLPCLRALPANKLADGEVRYLVQDGTYLTSSGLDLTTPGSVDVPILMGTMRDDASTFLTYPGPNDTLSDALSKIPVPNIPSLLSSGAFPLPSGPNTTLNIWNTTTRIATDGELRCLGQSTAYVGTKYRAFGSNSLYYYEFQMSYQLRSYNPNGGVCDPPAPGISGFKDEYFKCHSGELYYAFGNLKREGLKPRKTRDLPFSQYILDSWVSFVRTGNPTPDQKFLRARGFIDTLGSVVLAKEWTAVDPSKPKLMALDWDEKGGMIDFKEQEQCDVLGLGLDYYDR